jgi:hypothetical protein
MDKKPTNKKPDAYNNRKGLTIALLKPMKSHNPVMQ